MNKFGKRGQFWVDLFIKVSSTFTWCLVRKAEGARWNKTTHLYEQVLETWSLRGEIVAGGTTRLRMLSPRSQYTIPEISDK